MQMKSPRITVGKLLLNLKPSREYPICKHLGDWAAVRTAFSDNLPVVALVWQLGHNKTMPRGSWLVARENGGSK